MTKSNIVKSTKSVTLTNRELKINSVKLIKELPSSFFSVKENIYTSPDEVLVSTIISLNEGGNELAKVLREAVFSITREVEGIHASMASCWSSSVELRSSDPEKNRSIIKFLKLEEDYED